MPGVRVAEQKLVLQRRKLLTTLKVIALIRQLTITKQVRKRNGETSNPNETEINNRDKFPVRSGKKLCFTQPLKTSDRDGLKTHAEAVTEHMTVEQVVIHSLSQSG